MVRGVLAVSALVVASACAPPPPPADELPAGDIVEGSWRADRYVLASGPVHPLRGHIMFAGGDWNVLFFVLGPDGEPLRMSAEGGTYTLDGEDLVFTHLYYGARGEAMDGLPEAPFEMRALETGGAEEAATVSVEGDALTLFFPSGNQMTFARAGGAG
ncbi:MAG: hypothetical protein ACR2QM_15045 [Longimicrobiales bacterium]